jgi:murein DD-endopeptidase MepM/ murein hydrolase activator NlpD
VRVVLLAAFCAAFAGLALPGRATTPVSATAPAEQLLRPSVEVAPALLPATQPVRRVVRATRTRRSLSLWSRPVSAGINSPYGSRWGGWHPGVDFAAHYGAPIHVVTDGTVIGAGYLSGEGGYGQIVLVRHAGGFITAYAHMSKVLVHAGQRVHAGQTLGKVGATGHVTGPHLHFEVRVGGQKVNPVPWLRRHGVRV